MKDLFPDEYAILVHGPPGVGKREFCIDLASYYSHKDSRVIYVTTERSSKNIEERARGIFEDWEREGIFFIDYASWSTADKSGWLEGSKNTITIQNPHNLKDISLGIKTIAHNSPGKLKVVFDSLSPLFLYNESDKVVQFVQMLTSQVKSMNGFIAYTLQEAVHPPSTVNTLVYTVDGYIQLRFVEVAGVIKKQIRIHHLQGLKAESGWRDCVFTEKGLQLA